MFDLNPDRMIDVVLVSALFAFVGARLYYVLFSDRIGRLSCNDPFTILYVWEGGLGIYGGIIFAFITAIWMCRVRKVNTLAMFDLASLGFLIGQGIGRWGNFFNQEAFGGNTDLPWGMTGDISSSRGWAAPASIPGSRCIPPSSMNPSGAWRAFCCCILSPRSCINSTARFFPCISSGTASAVSVLKACGPTA